MCRERCPCVPASDITCSSELVLTTRTYGGPPRPAGSYAYQTHGGGMVGLLHDSGMVATGRQQLSRARWACGLADVHFGEVRDRWDFHVGRSAGLEEWR